MDECSGFENRRLAFERDRGFESPSLRFHLAEALAKAGVKVNYLCYPNLGNIIGEVSAR